MRACKAAQLTQPDRGPAAGAEQRAAFLSATGGFVTFKLAAQTPHASAQFATDASFSSQLSRAAGLRQTTGTFTKNVKPQDGDTFINRDRRE